MSQENNFSPVEQKDLELERTIANIPHTIAVMKIIAEHEHKWDLIHSADEVFKSNIECARKIVEYGFEHNIRIYDFDIFLTGFLRKSQEVLERVNMHMNQRLDNLDEALLGKRKALLTTQEIDEILKPWLAKKEAEKAEKQSQAQDKDEVIETLSEGTTEPTA